MDLHERHKDGSAVENRHPWELSRTKKVLKAYEKYLDHLHGDNKNTARKYVNIGAGDLYFDHRLLRQYKRDHAYAVDLEYDASMPREPRVDLYHRLEEVPDRMDYGIMMDSLEYMPDDAAYVRAFRDKIKNGGYLFFTLPAIPSVFSQHDRNVGNLRRYDRRSFRELIDQVPGVKIVEDHYFYTSLLLVRFLQVRLHLPIDRERKVTSYWKYPEQSMITRGIVRLLDLDFMIGELLGRMGIHLPGLSLLVVCRKTAGNSGIQRRR